MSNRPRAITILCVFLAVFGCISALGGINAAIQVPSIGRIWSLTSAALFLLSIVFLWRMSKWGPVIFAAITVVNLVIVFSGILTDVPVGARSWGALVLPTIYAIVVAPNWARFKAIRTGVNQSASSI